MKSIRKLISTGLAVIVMAGANAASLAAQQRPSAITGCTGIEYRGQVVAEGQSRSSHPVVEAVEPGSPAQEAQLQSGDVLLEIDGVDARRVERLFPGASGTEFTLRVQRQGKIVDLQLKTGRRMTALMKSGTGAVRCMNTES